jgi:branched-chain amino acid transport system substrate-binding protein
MATEEINASGGVMGRKIELISEDSVNPATAAKHWRSLPASVVP